MSWRRFFARRGQGLRDLDEEIEAHLRMAVRDRVERGESPEQARAAAAGARAAKKEHLGAN